MKTRPMSKRNFSSTDAPWADRQWFDLRPERAYRLRDVQPDEVQAFGGSSHIIVQKISANERMRVPVTLLGIPSGLKELLKGDGERADQLDAVLSECFAAALSGRAVELGRAIRAGLKKARLA